MDNAIWKILAFFLAAVLLFLVPLINLLERQDDAAFTVVFSETNRFVDSARDTGYITPDMYTEFLNRIQATGNTYSVSLKHIKSTVNPVYRQNGAALDFTGEYEINRVAVSEGDIFAILFPGGAVSALDKSRRYEMRAGDLLFVEVKNRGKTMATAIRDMLLMNDTTAPGIFVRAGGMVRNEAY